MSESAKAIVKDFDKVFKNPPRVESVQEQVDQDQCAWEILNRAIDCLREHVELGILQ